jgi:MFS family permease
MYAIAQFLPAFLIRTHGLNLRQAGFVSGVIIGIAGALGMCFGGRLADRFDAVRPGGRLLLGSFCVLGAVPLKLIALGLPAGKPYLFLFWMLLGCMLMYVYYSSVYAAIQNVVEPSLRGTAMAVYFLGMYALGGSLGPVVTGRLSDFFARRVQNAVQLGSPITEAAKAIGLHQAMYAIPTLECLVSLVLFAASRTYIRDRQKMHAWMESLSSAADPERPELPALAPAAR